MLYQEVRPRTFDEIVGNASVVSSLRKMVKQKVKTHTFLFTGPTGCGKTTLARIVAREVGCKDESIVELNAANTRGIDTSREISSKASLSSVFGGPKAYILDESHQLTKNAMEVLYKVIEEVPKHCYFFFCTTNPERFTPMFLGRCTDFQVHSLRQEEIFALLLRVVNRLNIEVAEEVLVLISEVCEGCPRRALTLLEKIKDIDDIDEVLSLIKQGEFDESDPRFNLCRVLLLAPHLREKRYEQILKMWSNVEGDAETTRIFVLSSFLRYLEKRCGSQEAARDVARMIEIFSRPIYSGGRVQLGALVAQAIFRK